jgi:hypothetical protein
VQGDSASGAKGSTGSSLFRYANRRATWGPCTKYSDFNCGQAKAMYLTLKGVATNSGDGQTAFAVCTHHVLALDY